MKEGSANSHTHTHTHTHSYIRRTCVYTLPTFAYSEDKSHMYVLHSSCTTQKSCICITHSLIVESHINELRYACTSHAGEQNDTQIYHTTISQRKMDFCAVFLCVSSIYLCASSAEESVCQRLGIHTHQSGAHSVCHRYIYVCHRYICVCQSPGIHTCHSGACR